MGSSARVRACALLTVAAVSLGTGGASWAAPPGDDSPLRAGDVRSKAKPGPGDAGAKVPTRAVPAGVAKKAAKQRYVAPKQVNRTPVGGVPAPDAAWQVKPSPATKDADTRRGAGAAQEDAGAVSRAAESAQQSTASGGGVAAPGLGIQGHYGMEEFPVRDGLGLGVNIANGNLVVRGTDLKINGPGVGTRWDRFYNGLSDRDGAYGPGWSLAGGADVGLQISTNVVVLRGPSEVIGSQRTATLDVLCGD